MSAPLMWSKLLCRALHNAAYKSNGGGEDVLSEPSRAANRKVDSPGGRHGSKK